MKSRTTVTTAAAMSFLVTGFFAAGLTSASAAGADPALPPPPPAPAPLGPPAAPAPPQAVDMQSAGTPDAPVAPPNGIPHLASPDALPPGSTMDPNATTGDSPDVNFLRNLWQAVQDHEISGKEALVIGLAQRGMSTPIPDQAPGPNVPLSPGDAPPPPPAPAP